MPRRNRLCVPLDPAYLGSGDLDGDAMVLIKPKIGDVLEPDGCILADGGTMMRSGVVIIHRSRLRRAKRYGWSEYTEPLPRTPLPHLVAVARA